PDRPFPNEGGPSVSDRSRHSYGPPAPSSASDATSLQPHHNCGLAGWLRPRQVLPPGSRDRASRLDQDMAWPWKAPRPLHRPPRTPPAELGSRGNRYGPDPAYPGPLCNRTPSRLAGPAQPPTLPNCQYLLSLPRRTPQTVARIRERA